MQTTTLSLGDAINEALSLLYVVTERPQVAAVGANALTSATDNQLTLTGLTVAVGDVLEIGQELLLVTDKSTDADPVYTVARGYLGTPANSSAPTGTAVLRNPEFSRYDLRRHVVRCISTAMSSYLPLVSTEEYQRYTDRQYVVMPANTRWVVRVQWIDRRGRFRDLPAWEFIDDVPTTVPGVTTGKLLRLPSFVDNSQVLYVTRVVPYTWNPGGDQPSSETSTVTVHAGSEDLPALFAAATAVSGREFSRLQIDRAEEWNQQESVRQGVNLQMVRSFWQRYYQRLDEARRLVRIPRFRQYRSMETV
jgi:hypothetical protein